MTAQTFCFNCKKYFGRSVDDGALERLLVADSYYGANATPSADSTINSLNTDNNVELESNNLSVGYETGLFGFISRPQSPVSGAYGTMAQRNNHFYSTGSLVSRKRSPSVGRSEYVISNKQTGFYKQTFF